ncbi:MAG: glycosyltransferase, partial [Halolamina sp.]
MAPTIAVAHYPEGAGHATRMLAVADAIEDAGGEVQMAGGGAGRAFVALNGYDAFEPTNVDFIDTYQGGSLWRTVRRSLPASLGRIADYQAWLTETEPDALVTDDMFAAMAASRCDVPQYVLKHDMPALYDDVTERAGAGVHTLFQLSAAREFFYPVVWPRSDADPAEATRIPPVALDGEPTVDADPDVVVVPSHYSSLSRIADHLRRQGYDVLDVAADDWEPVPSLLPYIRRADAVVCSGYSTIMDAAVAGTPCVVHPATDEQDAVADCLERHGVTGFTVAAEPIDVL